MAMESHGWISEVSLRSSHQNYWSQSVLYSEVPLYVIPSVDQSVSAEVLPSSSEDLVSSLPPPYFLVFQVVPSSSAGSQVLGVGSEVQSQS